MNWDIAKGQWKQFRGQVQEQWGKLTDDDLDKIEGKRDQLLGAVQKRYGIARDEAEKQLSKIRIELRLRIAVVSGLPFADHFRRSITSLSILQSS